MFEDYERQKRQRLALRRSITDYVIGILIAIVGVFFVIRRYLPLEFNENYPPDLVDTGVGIMFIAYGAWRIYRGYKKNYFKE